MYQVRNNKSFLFNHITEHIYMLSMQVAKNLCF